MQKRTACKREISLHGQSFVIAVEDLEGLVFEGNFFEFSLHSGQRMSSQKMFGVAKFVQLSGDEAGYQIIRTSMDAKIPERAKWINKHPVTTFWD